MIKKFTASAESAPHNSPSDLTVEEAFRAALDKGWNDVVKEQTTQPWMGEAFVRQRKVDTDSGKQTSFRGWNGMMPLNRDADTLPMATKGLGFSWNWSTYTRRVGIAIERKAMEIDDVGYTKGAQVDMMDMYRRTVEMYIADHFNRALGVSGAPRLADDGLYYLASDRPSPNPAAPDWSNLEATAELTEDTLFDAYYNASRPDGNLFPQKIRKVMLPPSYKKTAWKVVTTDRVLGSNNNDANWAPSEFEWNDFIFYDYLTQDVVIYWLSDPKSEDNELILFVRKQPNYMSGWGLLDSNPDVLGMRLRADFGLGLGNVRKSVRGGPITPSSS